ncbi:hypothetical protein Ddye_021927 [Dipteronia dyeriana]|uniref:RNase H type-1 domain-containing protein n=1 Tax=Dipteronia dyeriana TaxID=168575 RepID=A0AAD9U2N1_9ROSI|nr:hypothetical protein Ddye_021927 [Dipteronia dyeriana]
MAHSLFWCKEAKSVWDISTFGSLVGSFRNLLVSNVLRGVLGSISREVFADFFGACGKITTLQSIMIPVELLQTSLTGPRVFWPSLKVLRKFFFLLRDFIFTLILIPTDWLSPPVGLLKLDSDVEVRAGCNEIGLGAVIKDASSRVVAAISKSVAGNVTVELGKLLALREGLLLAKSFNLIIWVAEVDA